jgi:PadR family transcriptional regulator, regulatory protein PadR
MPEASFLGDFEQIVLLAVLRLGDHAYGLTIRSEITACTGHEPGTGALHTTLERLEEKGFLTSRFGDPTPQRGGRAKRYFAVSVAGIKSVVHSQRCYQRMLEGLELPGLMHE